MDFCKVDNAELVATVLGQHVLFGTATRVQHSGVHRQRELPGSPVFAGGKRKEVKTAKPHSRL